MTYKLNSLSLIALLLGSGNVMFPPVAGATPSHVLVSQNSSDEDFRASTQADRWFFIAKTAIYKGDFDTGLINLRRAQRDATYDCLREAATRSLSATQAGKDALKNGASVEEAIKIYQQKILGSPECW